MIDCNKLWNIYIFLFFVGIISQASHKICAIFESHYVEEKYAGWIYTTVS